MINFEELGRLVNKELSITKVNELFTIADSIELEKLKILFHDDDRKGVVNAIKKADKRISDLNKELLRIEEMKCFENKYSEYKYIAGIDEVGRGPLAGPVVTCSVILPKDCNILYINDSKKLTEKRRNDLSEIIKEQSVSYSIASRTPQVIDDVNILQATYQAMKEAVDTMKITPDLLLNDAVIIPGLEMKQVKIIHGDAKSISIAAASIVAKVYRDALMTEYDKIYPEYGFASNKGYGSAAHIEALRKYGPCSIHRMSFIKNLI